MLPRRGNLGLALGCNVVIEEGDQSLVGVTLKEGGVDGCEQPMFRFWGKMLKSLTSVHFQSVPGAESKTPARESMTLCQTQLM